MSDVNSKECDVCGVLKKEVNGWFFVFRLSNGCVVSGPIDLGPSMHRASDKVKNRNKLFDVCGQACLIRKQSELLGNLVTRNVEPPEVVFYEKEES